MSFFEIELWVVSKGDDCPQPCCLFVAGWWLVSITFVVFTMSPKLVWPCEVYLVDVNAL